MSSTRNEIPEPTTEKIAFDPRTKASFWFFHPIGRGAGTGLLCAMFSTTVNFQTGFLYGAMSGVYNVMTRAVTYGSWSKDAAPEAQALAYTVLCTVPWLASALTMRHIHKLHHNPLFHVSTRTAVGAAIAVELLGYANNDILNKKPKARP